MLEILYEKRDPLSRRQKVKQTQIKDKQFTSSRIQRKLIHDPYISTKCSWKERDIFKKYSKKFKYFPSNILGVLPEKIFLKCNECDFLTPI